MSSPNSKKLKQAAARVSTSTDAFAVLMSNSRKQSPSSNKRRRKSSSSRFVLCPAGCGKHILESKINAHLDECIISSNDIDQGGCEQAEIPSTSYDEVPLSSDCLTGANEEEEALADFKEHQEASVSGPSPPTPLTKLETEQQVEEALDNNETDIAQLDNTSTSITTHASASPATEEKQGATTEGQTESSIVTQPATQQTPQNNNSDETNIPVSAEDPSIATSSQPKNQSTITEDEHESLTMKSPPPAQTTKNTYQNTTTTAKRTSTDNVFERMMKKSKTVFSKKAKDSQQPLYFCLHDSNGRVSLGTSMPMDLEMTFPPSGLSMSWTGKASVRDSNSGVVPIVLATNIAPASDRHRLVRHHSRLSVPVLKSMLQKSIRRRRSMPAVRIAMELSDKSVVDLLRRLPIIVLEDSTLHPDFAFLVWVMMACSTSGGAEPYVLPPVLLRKVCQIVYEVASCPWVDPLHKSYRSLADPETAKDDNTPKRDDVPSFANLLSDRHDLIEKSNIDASAPDGHSLDSHNVEDAYRLLLWSMLARAAYGGMKCDTQMLKGYARLWKARFSMSVATKDELSKANNDADPKVEPSVATPEKDATNVVTTAASTPPVFPSSWKSLPSFIHVRARRQSRENVTPLFSSSRANHTGDFFCLDRLRLEDTCLQGVDYHCCYEIMDRLLADAELVNLSLDLLKLSNSIIGGEDTANGTPLPKEDRQSRKEHLAEIWKSCMWTYSSGVNRRLPVCRFLDQNKSIPKLKDVVESAHKQSEKQAEPHAELWSGLAAPKVLSFQRSYVQKRLA